MNRPDKGIDARIKAPMTAFICKGSHDQATIQGNQSTPLRPVPMLVHATMHLLWLTNSFLII
jgi:hypothetical protein